MNYLVEIQRWLYVNAVEALNAVQTGGLTNLPMLVATAFGFGMLHALLPGHGKAALASYYAGNGRVAGAIGSTALLIAIHVGLAIALVLAGFAVYQRTLGGAGRASDLQWASQVLIVVIGLWLLYNAFQHGKQHHSASALAVAAGLVPCPLTTFIMTYAVSKHMIPAGIMLSVGFAVGMICTVACFPLLAIVARKGVLSASVMHLLDTASRIGPWPQVVSAIAIVAVGLWPLVKA